MTEQIYQVGNLDCANCAKEVEQGVLKLDGVQMVRVDFSSGKMHLDGDVPYDVLRQRVETLGKTLAPADESVYRVGGLDCANCAKEVEQGVLKLDGVQMVRVDFSSGRLHLRGDVPYETLRQRVETLGKTLHIDDDSEDLAAQAESRRGLIGFVQYLAGRHETRLALVGGGLTLLTLALSMLAGLPESIAAILYTVAMLIVVYPIAKSGINNLRVNRTFSINLLMTIAALGAIVIGEYLEASTVIFLFAIGEALEGYTADRARDSLRSLMSLKPTRALRLDDDGSETDVHIRELVIGDRIVIRPGDQIPMDGTVIKGESSANQAPITGESMPVHKAAGDDVFAGSINGEGTLTVRVTHLAQDNTLSRIIRMVEDAQSVRAPSQRVIDRFANAYTPGIMLIALLVAILPPVLTGAPFFSTADEVGWLYRALTILVIACPCALVISTPVTVISAITAAARRGVLIKGGAHLEALGQIQAVAFDKTGTLTQGTPAVTMLRSVDCDGSVNGCDDCDDVLAMAAAVERHSTHPLAQAVMKAAEARQVEAVYETADSVRVMAGMGVQGMVADRQVTVGRHSLFDEQFPHDADLCRLVESAEDAGQTTMLVHDGERVSGFIAVADTVRPDSQQVVRDLNALGLTTIMLTGDNQTVARRVGESVGVTDVRAELMPDDKVTAVNALREQYQQVAMVGDGVNDTPALAAATVGIAMGGAGTAQALETADIALMADDLRQLPFAVTMARFTRQLIRQNIGLTFAMKLIFLVLAVGGSATLWMAVFADMGMSLVVTLNGMRPLRRVPANTLTTPPQEQNA